MSISKSLSPKLGASLSSGRSRFNTDDQFALANKILVPLLQGGLEIDKNNAKSCLSFKISNMLGDEINQINFRIDSSGHVRFMDLDSNDALFSPEGAIEYVCQNSKFLRSLETNIGIELISSNYSFWSPLFKVQTNANAVNMINLLTKEETKFDMVFMPQLKAWRIPLRFNPQDNFVSHSGAVPFFDDVWQHVSSFIPISEIPTFRSVCHCFAARSFNDRFFKAVEFRNIAFISYLKSSLESQVEITHTKDMNQEDISNALKEEFPYCIQKSGHEEHANQREFKPFLFDFKLTNKGHLKLKVARTDISSGFEVHSICEVLRQMDINYDFLNQIKMCGDRRVG